MSTLVGAIPTSGNMKIKLCMVSKCSRAATHRRIVHPLGKYFYFCEGHLKSHKIDLDKWVEKVVREENIRNK